MRKSGILSDDYYNRNCVENMPLKIGLAQKLYPYQRNALAGVPLPKDLPVAQRGYEMSRVALDLSKLTKQPYDNILSMLKEESRKLNIEKLQNVTTVVKQSDKQQSFLAKSIKPRQSDFSQLSRATVAPTGSVMPKTGMLTEEEEQSFSEPAGELAPPEERM